MNKASAATALLTARSTSDISPTTSPSRVTPSTQTLPAGCSQIRSIGGCRVLGGKRVSPFFLFSPSSRERNREDRRDRPVQGYRAVQAETRMRTIASTDIDTDADLGVLVGALILGYNSILQKNFHWWGLLLLFLSTFFPAQNERAECNEHVTLSNGGIEFPTAHISSSPMVRVCMDSRLTGKRRPISDSRSQEDPRRTELLKRVTITTVNVFLFLDSPFAGGNKQTHACQLCWNKRDGDTKKKTARRSQWLRDADKVPGTPRQQTKTAIRALEGGGWMVVRRSFHCFCYVSANRRTLQRPRRYHCDF